MSRATDGKKVDIDAARADDVYTMPDDERSAGHRLNLEAGHASTSSNRVVAYISPIASSLTLI